MHQALYRKYRPQTFSDVCGQEHISNTLKAQVSEKRFSHAYLFTGSRGTGKTSSAKILAKAVNCLHPVNGDPCNECEICKGIDNGSILDVVEMDAASNNRVDDVRTLNEQISFTPTKAKYRVYIIDEFHMMSSGAFNALLKTIEEPPEHGIFILATTEVWKIPTTILSRCQRFDFNRISVETIIDRIKYVCSNENIEIDDNAATLIAKLADGGMRDALSLLDLCASTNEIITEQSVGECAGLIGKDYLFDIVDLIENKDAGGILRKLDELYTNSCDMEMLISELIGHYRDLLVAKTTNDYKKLITATNEEIELIGKQAKKIRFESILYCVDKLTACLNDLKRGSNKRTVVETTLIVLCTNELDSSSSAILKRIAKLEKDFASGEITVSSSPKKAEENIALADTFAADIKADKEGIPPEKIENHNYVKFEQWPEVMEILQNTSMLVYSVLNNSVAYTEDNLLLIDAPNESFSETLNSQRRFIEDIRSAVKQVSSKQYRLGSYRKVREAENKNDPLEKTVSLLGKDADLLG